MMRAASQNGWMPATFVVALAVLAISLALRGRRLATSQRMASVGLAHTRGEPRSPTHAPTAGDSGARRLLRFSLAPIGASIGWILAGPMGLLVGGGAGAAVPLVRARRQSRQRTEALERDLAQLAATTSLALRSGLSVSQALEFAGSELVGATQGLFERFLEERRFGIPFDAALERFGATLGSDDAQLFVLVMSVHARSGGDLAGALDEVVTTIRHRVAVRRELRAASAQGRVSGAILGALPIAFFLVLAATSHRQLGPVYRSAPGVAMVTGGLVMEGLAYLWIRRLLRIEV
jgi:tight adherence protein B